VPRHAPSLISVLEAQLATERRRCRRLEAQLRNLADHDPLTDLLNRRSLEHELEVHLARCNRYGPEGVLLLVGLDGVEGIADGLGHRQCDEVLATLGERVAERLRETDVAGRWEPQELAVLLPRAEVGEAEELAAALIEVVGGTNTRQVPPGSLVASIGAAPVVSTPTEAGELVERAETAMAAVRHRGGGGWLAAVG